MEIPVFLPIEIRKREFDGRLLLAYGLAKKGISVIIGDRAGCLRELINYKSSIYIAKSLSYDLKPSFSKIRKRGGKIFVLFEEGGIVARQKDKYEEIKSFYPVEMIPMVDKVFVYGESFRNLLIGGFHHFNSQNTFIAGNSRFDLHKPKYKSIYKNKVDEIKSRYGKYILFNGNFVLGNHYLGTEYFAREISQTKEISDELKEIYLSKISKNQAYLINFINMIKEISQEFLDYKLIVRPHPGENMDIYHKNFNAFENIVVNCEGTATPWIIGSELVVHQDCTTAIESILAEKPVISFLPTPDTSEMFWLSVYLSEKVYSVSELVKLVKEYLSGDRKFQLSSEQKKCFNEEIINASEETAPLISSLIKKTIREMSESGSKTGSNVKLNNMMKIKMLRILGFYHWFSHKYIKKTGYSKKFIGVTRKEIIEKLDKLKKTDDFSGEIKVKRMGVNTYHLKSYK